MSELFQSVELRFVFGGMAFFFLGYALAPWVYHKEIKWLLRFPLWLADKLEQWSKKKINPWLLFLFIFFMNTLSLSIDLISGLALFLPALFAIWTGINIGVVTFHTLKGDFYYAALFNPVALLELPAVFITFALALNYNYRLLGFENGNIPLDLNAMLNTFVWVVLPLLFIAAVIETFLIQWAQKIEDNEN